MCIEETTLYKMHLVIDTNDTQPATMLSPVDWSQGPMKFFSLNALGPTCTSKASLKSTGGELVLNPKLDNIANAYGVKEGSDVPKNGSSAQIGQSANFKFKRPKQSCSEA